MIQSIEYLVDSREFSKLISKMTMTNDYDSNTNTMTMMRSQIRRWQSSSSFPKNIDAIIGNDLLYYRLRRVDALIKAADRHHQNRNDDDNDEMNRLKCRLLVSTTLHLMNDSISDSLKFKYLEIMEKHSLNDSDSDSKLDRDVIMA